MVRGMSAPLLRDHARRRAKSISDRRNAIKTAGSRMMHPSPAT
jgi:hypothetical protein